MYRILILFIFFISCTGNVYEKDLKEILHVNSVEIEESYSLDEGGGVRGDGYVIEVYKLSENTIKLFKSNSQKTLPVIDSEWLKQDWASFPIDSNFNEVKSTVLDYSAFNEELGNVINELQKIVIKENSFYAFYCKPDTLSPFNVRFFILDVTDRKLYIVEHNL